MVGNKVDDVDKAEVSRKEANAVAKAINANIFHEVSAKTGTNIEKLFHDLGAELIKRDASVKMRTTSMALTTKTDKKKGGCCGGKKKDKK